jgi:hypothetical protein
MLPTTEFSNLRRSTTIAECVMAVAPPCKSITLNPDCYLLSLKCCKAEKRKMDSIAAARKLCTWLVSRLLSTSPKSTVPYASHPRKLLRISPGRDSRCLNLSRPPCSVERWRRIAW